MISVTLASGAYTLQLPAGKYFVAFTPSRDSGYISQHWRAADWLSQATLLTVSGNIGGIDASLGRSFSVAGTVSSATNGLPVEGVRVNALLSPPTVAFSTSVDVATTDAAGRFMLFVRGGHYRIEFRPPSGSTYVLQYWKNTATLTTAADLLVSSNLVQIDAALTGVTSTAPTPRPSVALIELKVHQCQEEASLRSLQALQAATVQVLNLTSRPVRIYWLDYQGRRQLYATLQIGQSYVQQTFATHPWLAADLSGNCIAIFVAEPGTARASIR